MTAGLDHTVLGAAQRVAGAVAARGRGDVDGARALLAFDTHKELASGALLVAELALGLLSRERGETLDASAGDLSLHLLGMRD